MSSTDNAPNIEDEFKLYWTSDFRYGHVLKPILQVPVHIVAQVRYRNESNFMSFLPQLKLNRDFTLGFLFVGSEEPIDCILDSLRILRELLGSGACP